MPTESETHFRGWSDEKIPIPATTVPERHVERIRGTAQATPKGLTKPFDSWTRSEDAKKYANEKIHGLRSTWGKIGANIRYGRFAKAAELWRGLGREEKAVEVERRALGMPGTGFGVRPTGRRGIRRGF